MVTSKIVVRMLVSMSLGVVFIDSTETLGATPVEVDAVVGSPVVANYKAVARNVVCNMTSAFPALTTLAPSPWSCPSAVNITGTWCNFTGVTCRPATGRLPAPVYMLYISLSGKGIKGSLPSALGQLTQLERLVLDTNLIYGTVPAALAGMASCPGMSRQAPEAPK